MHTHMHTYIHAYIHSCMHTHMHSIHTYTLTYTHTRIHICTLHTYTTHTHIHTYTHLVGPIPHKSDIKPQYGSTNTHGNWCGQFWAANMYSVNNAWGRGKYTRNRRRPRHHWCASYGDQCGPCRVTNTQTALSTHTHTHTCYTHRHVPPTLQHTTYSCVLRTHVLQTPRATHTTRWARTRA